MIDPRDEASRERLSTVLGVRRWADEVAAGGPYPSVDALVQAGDRAAAGLSESELDEAVAHLPPIGSDADEQAGLRAQEEGVGAAIARGDEVYQQRFGRAFLVSTAGRSRQEVLDELQRRLKNAPDVEAEEARAQLREIAGLRLRSLFGDG